MRHPIAMLCLLSMLCAGPDAARAKVEASAGDMLLVRHTYALATTPAKAWQALVHPERWWPSAHTWSGDAKRLRLSAEAGGCFCERWADGSAEHGRVILARREAMLRLDAPLGPLQEMGLAGLLQVTLKGDGDTTVADVTFRVSGDSAHALGTMAPVIDQVIGEQFGRYAAFAQGKPWPDAPAKP